MKLNEGMFAIKLYELEQQYGRMQSRLRLCQQEKHSKIQKELQKAIDEYRENEILLQKSVEGSRSQGSRGAGKRPTGLLPNSEKNTGAVASGISAK